MMTGEVMTSWGEAVSMLQPTLGQPPLNKAQCACLSAVVAELQAAGMHRLIVEWYLDTIAQFVSTNLLPSFVMPFTEQELNDPVETEGVINTQVMMLYQADALDTQCRQQLGLAPSRIVKEQLANMIVPVAVHKTVESYLAYVLNVHRLIAQENAGIEEIKEDENEEWECNIVPSDASDILERFAKIKIKMTSLGLWDRLIGAGWMEVCCTSIRQYIHRICSNNLEKEFLLDLRHWLGTVMHPWIDMMT
eukprot:Ihof_evm1s517 gene=Ihof_evmTU1s517